MMEHEKEYIEWLRQSIKEFADGILVDNEKDLSALKMTYGFARTCFMESRAGKAVHNHE